MSELTKQEVATMWVYADEYSKQTRGIKDFYLLLSESRKRNIERFLHELDEAPLQSQPEESHASLETGK
jgi:hypothetical protein